MRPRVDEASLHALARALGRVVREPVKLYLTGGASAVIEGWRSSTVDVDLRLEPELEPLLRELPILKERLNVNVELVSPPDFIPELPGWRERSPLLFREGSISVHHFDLYSQALAKIERGFEQDLDDVAEMLERGLIKPSRLLDLFNAIEPDLYRYPAIDPHVFAAKLQEAVKSFSESPPDAN